MGLDRYQCNLKPEHENICVRPLFILGVHCLFSMGNMFFLFCFLALLRGAQTSFVF